MFLTSLLCACVLHPGNTPFSSLPTNHGTGKVVTRHSEKVHDVFLLFSVIFPEESHVTQPDIDQQVTCFFTWINWVIQFEFRHVRVLRSGRHPLHSRHMLFIFSLSHLVQITVCRVYGSNKFLSHVP